MRANLRSNRYKAFDGLEVEQIVRVRKVIESSKIRYHKIKRKIPATPHRTDFYRYRNDGATIVIVASRSLNNRVLPPISLDEPFLLYQSLIVSYDSTYCHVSH